MIPKKEIFQKIPIFGMIHLAGTAPVKRALEEISLFEEEGIDGAIIENYHGSIENVLDTLEETKKRGPKLVIGVNILPNQFELAFPVAHDSGADFIQLDYVAGTYNNGRRLNVTEYTAEKEKYSDIFVLGGVWPKYYQPVKNSNLEIDLLVGMTRAEDIVVTGAGTGQETPIGKIHYFRSVLGDHPLIIGAGLTPENGYEQLSIADGAIVGSCLKTNSRTENPIERTRVRELISVVKEVRRYRGINQ